MPGQTDQRRLFYPKTFCLEWEQLQHPFFLAIYSINAILFYLILSIPINFFLEWNLKPLSLFFQKFFSYEIKK